MSRGLTSFILTGSPATSPESSPVLNPTPCPNRPALSIPPVSGSANSLPAAAVAATGGELHKQRVVMLGAGSAGIGISNLLVAAMINEGLSEEEARAIEPRVKTCGRALFSPTTASVDPSDVMSAMKDDAVNEGVSIVSGVTYLKKDEQSVVTSGEVYRPGYVVNAAGLYADRIARDFGFSQDYRILPFKGLYLYSDEPPFSVRTNVYPVPDLRNPFLGVHYTVAVDGTTKIGPTAIPVLWREHYSGLENFKFSEFADIIFRQAGLFVGSDFDFKRLALEEIRKNSRQRLVELASELMTDVDVNHYRRWGRPGIRAQLMNIRTKRLEMDFVIEGDNKSMHVLNAVSPGFTCSLPFSEYVCNEISKQIH